MEASQVQEVFDHLTFNGNIQRRVGVEAAETKELEPAAFVSVAVPVCVHVSHLGDMLTSRIQGLRFSSNMMSKPNSSWQLYGDRTFIFSKLRTYGSDLINKEYI